MDASAWIALAALAFVVVAQLVAIAFLLGGLFNRMKVVEAKPTDTDCKAELSLLTYKFGEMEKTLADVASDLRNLLSGKLTPARRVSSQ